MELNEYQKAAMTTCMPSCDNFAYMFLNLVGELGEFASKIAKHIRKEHTEIRYNGLADFGEITQGEMTDLRRELGDCLWQLSGLCHVLGWRLEDVAQENLTKLASRQQRNVIIGDGDNR